MGGVAIGWNAIEQTAVGTRLPPPSGEKRHNSTDPFPQPTAKTGGYRVGWNATHCFCIPHFFSAAKGKSLFDDDDD